MSDSKTKTSLQQLLFGNPDVSSRANNLDNNLDVYEYERLTQDKNERPSAYVAAFEGMGLGGVFGKCSRPSRCS